MLQGVDHPPACPQPVITNNPFSVCSATALSSATKSGLPSSKEKEVCCDSKSVMRGIVSQKQNEVADMERCFAGGEIKFLCDFIPAVLQTDIGAICRSVSFHKTTRMAEQSAA